MAGHRLRLLCLLAALAAAPAVQDFCYGAGIGFNVLVLSISYHY